MGTVTNSVHREPWNKGKIVGQKAPFKNGAARPLALFGICFGATPCDANASYLAQLSLSRTNRSPIAGASLFLSGEGISS